MGRMIKTERRNSLDAIDSRLASSLAAGLRSVEFNPGRRSALRERILDRIRDPAPEGTFTLRATEPGWVTFNDRVQIRVLRRDLACGDQTILIRMLPGAQIDAHPHTQEEECYVIDGEIEIGNHCLRRGDMHVAPRGTAHQRILSRTGALLLVRAEIPAEGANLA
jgi:quercetin dioxygenase-like cupin family protein